MLKDGHNRVVDYLRISVTERCNFRCQYCMPDKPFSWKPKENLLSFEEMFLFVKTAIDEGINKIRITGGEPLLREDLDKFIRYISEYKSDIDLALTTNGYLLKSCAKPLKDAGLKRLNISLDTLKDDVALKITGKNVLKSVIDGIQEAKKVGLGIKLNSVPLKGINDDEIITLLEYAKDNDMTIRYIEYMENRHASSNIIGLNGKEILDVISQKYNFTKVGRSGASPSFNYKLDDGYVFGIIDPHKHDFCESCNRIRLTAEGLLIPCLYFEDALSIKDAIKEKDISKACQILQKVLQNKPKENKWGHGSNESSSRAFYETGG